MKTEHDKIENMKCICDLCGREVMDAYTCEVCCRTFCVECGDSFMELCEECINKKEDMSKECKCGNTMEQGNKMGNVIVHWCPDCGRRLRVWAMNSNFWDVPRVTEKAEEKEDYYDSYTDTKKHILRVRQLSSRLIERIISVSKFVPDATAERLRTLANNFADQIATHDQSKLKEPEKSIFDEYTPKLSEMSYGSDEYNSCKEEMSKALDHHYSENRHHPEHFENGIKDMDIVDVLEMACDWKASSERHNDGNYENSVYVNRDRFNYGFYFESRLANLFNDDPDIAVSATSRCSSMLDVAINIAFDFGTDEGLQFIIDNSEYNYIAGGESK